MASDMQVRRSLMRAVGSQSVAVAIIDNAAHTCPTCAKTRAALVDGLEDRPLVRLQTCPAGVHRDWWADGEDLDCPWCRVAELEGAPASASAGAA